jgi:hypothetical protein
LAYFALSTVEDGSCTSRVCYEDTWGLPPEYVESLFTDWSDGVRFDSNGDGAAELTSWTTQFSDDAFLVLDRNGNGTIDDYSELFGNWTAQAPSISPNGFLALSLFDGKTWGGNEDGVISRSDLAYFVLQLWLDQNHNGMSEAHELRPLSEHILAIELNYVLQRLLDEHGNQLRYRVEVYFLDGRIGTAYDVILVPAP